MYVKSTPINHNGIASTEIKIYRKWGGTWYDTRAQAWADKDNFDASSNLTLDYTERRNMQKGVVSYKKYKNTAYYCYHSRRDYASNLYQLLWSGGHYRVETTPITIGEGWGSATFTDVISPCFSSNTSVMGIYNSSVVNNLANRARAEAMVKSLDQKLDLAELLVDLPETVKLIAGTSIRLIKAYKAVRKGNLKEAFGLLGVTPKLLKGRTWAELWLELQYGWLPLVNDIYGGVQLANSLMKNNGNPQFVVTRRLKDTLSPGPVAGSIYWTKYEMSVKAFCSVEVKYRLKIRDANLAFLSSVGLINPAYIAWIAMPYSFVIDWMFPVSTWLQAMTAPFGIDFVTGYQTTRRWADFAVIGYDKRPYFAGTPLENRGYALARKSAAEMSRQAFTSWPGFLPYYRFPFSSDQRIASAIALIVSSGRH